MTLDTQRIRDSFDRQTMLATLGARLDAVDEGAVTISAPILDLARQQQGFGHAGLTFTLGDTAAGYAALTLMPAENEVVTAEMKIHLMSPAVGDRIVAKGRVIRPGRRLMVVAADVFALKAGSERHIAFLSGTMVPVSAQTG